MVWVAPWWNINWGVKMFFLCHVRSYLQVHQLELDSLGQQIRENKKNSRLVRACPVKPVTPVSVSTVAIQLLLRGNFILNVGMQAVNGLLQGSETRFYFGPNQDQEPVVAESIKKTH